MSRRRLLILGGLLLFVAVVVALSVMPWKWHGQLDTPAGVPAQYVVYTCAAPWGAAYVHGPAQTAYPVVGTPCGERTQYQIMSLVDLVLGGAGLVVVAGWGTTRLRRATV